MLEHSGLKHTGGWRLGWTLKVSRKTCGLDNTNGKMRGSCDQAHGMPEIRLWCQVGMAGGYLGVYVFKYLFLSFTTFQAGLEPLQSSASLKSTLLLPQPLKC